MNSGASSPASSGSGSGQRRRRVRRPREERAERYAGSKWGLSPAAEALPPPPTHWRRGGCFPDARDSALSLKLLLNVVAV